ncbi:MULTISPECIES: c-type cytochrome biogenesis protein CcmI [Acidiphilium]|uniref:Putative cytochrome c-type biogenesis protein n=2 Tax=Acidocellaceae TaxID=3385905 RepID=F0J600_ACIMA|nr:MULTISPECIES: c-type cytochrome biogenesis protein CcmI [Acidiphilium]EGO96257.1 Cytochrome c biogenesis factor-like protein [Acidiphilium sp. PM]MBU6356077.1 c-type cytochrome biogenesis protein CcmI [Rhodospirillales bacterium]BAJ82544.1 putative cytochrome c-type biogenesis protein [Acidiphilium multivorum AIU301]MBS3022727.1 c-type cytochrome biogenesis protein CcmI [Acidiphilium multivorum]UNC14472.1 c-type cytochrome biogenesis protein CcmI [Acidiphilium multivorum]
MIWLWMAVLAAVALAPVVLVWLRRGTIRYRRETAMALHRAQLEEIERDREEGRLPEEEYQAARLEVQRRLLAADQIPEPEANRAARGLMIATLAAIPVAAVVVFVPSGLPLVPSEPHASVMRQRAAAERQDNALIDRLKQKLAELPPGSPDARQGYLLLGQALVSQNKLHQAARAWHVALTIKFDPTLAAETAEAESEAAGHVTPDAAALFRKALAEAPAQAPWRSLAEQRLREAAVLQSSNGSPPLSGKATGATSTP